MEDMGTSDQPSGLGQAVPVVELEGPDGQRVTVAPRDGDDSVAELAGALGIAPSPGATWAVTVNGRPVSGASTLTAAGILRGVRIDAVESDALSRTRPRGDVHPGPTETVPAAIVTCVAGPAVGPGVPIGEGRHVVGRAASATVVVDDRDLEPHHGLLHVSADREVRFNQVTGRIPCRVGGDPLRGETPLASGATLVLGASRLLVTTIDPDDRSATSAALPASLAAIPGDPWRRSLRRAPRARPIWDPTPIPLPDGAAAPGRAGGIGLASALLGAAGSGAVALLLDQPMFLLFGLIGVAAAVGSWIAARVGSVRAGRRAGANRRHELAAFAAEVESQRCERTQFHLATAPTATDAISAGLAHAASLWTRRADHDDAFRVCIGWGRVEWDVTTGDGELDDEAGAIVARAAWIDDVPVSTDVGPGVAMAVCGVDGDAAIRSMIVQLATWTGPADWRLLVLADDPRAWDWCRWLPHAALGDDTMVIDADHADEVAGALARLDDGDTRHVVLVTDRVDLLSARTGSVRRFLAASPSAAVVVRVASVEGVPALCRRVLDVGAMGVARWTTDTAVALAPEHIHVAGMTTTTARTVARRLAPLVDPEDPGSIASALPTAISLGALAEGHGLGAIDDPIAVAATWRSGGADPPPAAVIGLADDGLVEVDLVRDGPHALVAGTTGSGKSELLRTLVVSLAARSSPDHLCFVLVDYKGGSTFDACAELPHTVGIVTDLDERLAERALVSLHAELQRRERCLRDAVSADLGEYRRDPARPPLPRLVVVIDEFAALAAELPGFLTSLVGVAQRGRSLGVHLVLATQRPAGVVSDEIRANTNLRIALRLHDAAEARDIVGDDGPATFARGTPGRAMMRLGPAETVLFQSARSSGQLVPQAEQRLRIATVEAPPSGDVAELTVLVRAIRHAAALCDTAPAHRPWLPPLPDRLGPAGLDGHALDPGVVGLVDDPTSQCRRPLRWAPADGNLALIGARGSGTSTALTSVVVARCCGRSPADVHVYVVDGSGVGRLDSLASLAHCGAIVGIHEHERLCRLLRLLRAELDRGRAPDGCSLVGTGPTRDSDRRPDRELIVAVDGMPAVRAALDQPSTAPELDVLTRVMAEGPGLGMACVLTAERPGSLPPTMLAACAERWVFHLDDPAEGAMIGLGARAIPGPISGRLVVASSGLEAQIAGLSVPDTGEELLGDTPPPIGVLPADVDAAGLPRGGVGPSGDVVLSLGICFDRLAPAHLAVPDGEHLLVAGPARSGRTTALARVIASWREAHPGGVVLVLAPAGRSTLADVAGCRLVAAPAGLDIPDGACLVVVDDAERVDDPGDRLAALATSRRPGLMIAAAGRPEALRSLYGHWTSIVRRSRVGLLLSACADTDGDVLGEVLPRHPPLRPRPGLAWLIAAGDRALVQIAR